MPICSELGAAHTGDDIRTVISPLSTFQQNFRPNTNNGTSNFQNLLSNMNHASLHTNLAPAGSYSDDIRHHTPFPLTGAAEFVGGNADVPFQESYEISPTPTSVFQNLTGCHPSAGQNAPSNGHRADFWWSGILDTTWNSNLGQVEPFNEGMVDQRWSGEFGNDVPTNYQSTFSYDPLALQFLIMQKGAFE